MIVPVIYPSAGEFWLHSDPYTLIGYSFNSRKLMDLPAGYEFSVTSKIALEVAEILDVSTPLFLTAPHQNYKRKGRSCVVQKHSVFPPNSFVYLRRREFNIYLACPELCFLLAARSLDLIDLVKFGYDLCALYYENPESKYGQSDRVSYTFTSLIKDYLVANRSFHSSVKALKALKYVYDFSNSPMETRLAMFSSLSEKYGGCGMRLSSMNKAIILTEEGRQLTGYGELHGDLVFDRVVVEYNSNALHLDAAHYTDDMNRQTALKLAGYDYIAVTAGNIKNYYSLINVMNAIRVKLKMKPLEDDPLRKKLYIRLFCT